MAEQTNTLETIDVRTFMNQFGYVQVHKEVRANTNGFPYVTFINGSNEAENIYFSRKTAAKYDEGESIGRGFFDNLAAAETTNAAGEKRWKLVTPSGGNRLDASDLF